MTLALSSNPILTQVSDQPYHDTNLGSQPLTEVPVPQPVNVIPLLLIFAVTLHDSRSTAFSYDGKYAASGSIDMSIKIFDTSRIRSNFLGLSDEKPVMRTLYDHVRQSVGFGREKGST